MWMRMRNRRWDGDEVGDDDEDEEQEVGWG